MTELTEDYKATKAKIKNYLLALGISPQQVANKLDVLGITGRMNDDANTPIARYLNIMLTDWRSFTVLVRYDPCINQTLEVKIAEDLYVFWDLNEVVEFLYEFDCEKHPALIDRLFKEQIRNAMAL